MRISDWSSDVCSSDLAFNLLHMRVVRISRATEQETRMTRRFAFAALACTALSAPAFAQDAPSADDAPQDGGALVVPAARPTLPPNTLPLTVHALGKAARSGSTTCVEGGGQSVVIPVG